MIDDYRAPLDSGIEPIAPVSPYVLVVSVGGSMEHRYRLSCDKPTWTGRKPHDSFVDYDYLHIPGSVARYNCGFEWDTKEKRFWVITGGAGYVRINAEAVYPQQRRLLNEGDVIIVSRENGGPHCVRLALVTLEK